MAGKGRGVAWFKYGCFGCLGVLLFILILAAVISGVAWNRVQSQDVQEKVVSRELPSRPEPVEEPEITTENLELERPDGIGHIHLDLANGTFHIEPADPGEPLRIEASYDAAGYSFEEGFEESTRDGVAWVYKAKFHRTSNPVLAALARVFGGTEPKLTIYLPRDTQMDLELELEDGGANVELGGLWLRDTSIDFARGGFNVQISEPLREPAESLSIHGSMGGFMASGIGNASPRTFDIDLRMGGMNLDLRGRWERDADIKLRWGMGGGRVQLPPNVLVVGIDGIDGIDGLEPTGEVSPPTLTFELRGKMDDMKFVP